MESLQFCFRSLGQFADAGPLGLICLVGNAVLDICDASTAYQVEMARIEMEEMSQLELKKLTTKTKQNIKLLKAAYEKRIKEKELDWREAEKGYQEAIRKLLRRQKRESR